jgi:hypothetical protein
MNPSPRQKFERDIDDVRQLHDGLVTGSKGSPDAAWLFFGGLVLAAAGLWFLLANVRVTTHPFGLVSGVLSRGVFGGGGATASTGVVFVPIFAGLVMLFYDSRRKAGWWLFYAGLLLLVIEIFSRIQFVMNMRTSNLLLMLGMIAAGVGMMLRSLRGVQPATPDDEPPKP